MSRYRVIRIEQGEKKEIIITSDDYYSRTEYPSIYTHFYNNGKGDKTESIASFWGEVTIVKLENKEQ